MIVCNRCGKENQDHYKFCLGCGAELSPDEGPNVGTMKTMMADQGGRTPTPPGGVPHHAGGGRLPGVGAPPQGPMGNPGSAPHQMGPMGNPGSAPHQMPMGPPMGGPPMGGPPMGPGGFGGVGGPARTPAPQYGVPARAPAGPPPGVGAAGFGPPPGGPPPGGGFGAPAPGGWGPPPAGMPPGGPGMGAPPPQPMGGMGMQPAPAPAAAAGLRKCPQCGSDVPPNFKFCGVCGSAVAIAPPSQQPAPAYGGSPAPSFGAAPAQQPRALITLIRPDGSEGGTFPLREGENKIGRDHGQIFENDGYLSPTHCDLIVQGSSAVVRDLDSLNGVFVRMTGEEEIQPGQIIRMGQELLRFDLLEPPTPLEDGTEVMGSPNPGYWGKITVIIGNGVDGSAYPLLGESVTMGRERGDINFPDDGYVSGLHARLSARNGKVFLADLGSSNGTFLRVQGERKIGHESFVLLGQQLFRLGLR
jgi:pSer/pThr/pTyr-binding forkhead associated (FHA) protein